MRRALGVVLAALLVGAGSVVVAPVSSSAPAAGQGYWLVGADGAVYGFGGASAKGGARPGGNLVTGIAPTPSGNGYWLVARDGGVYAYGDAGLFGSAKGLRLSQPVVGMAATPTGRGYWLVAADGGLFSFGDAQFLGSTGSMRLNRPIVGMASSPTGRGYWFVASDGGIFSFGDARFFGSTGALQLNRPIVGMASSPMGRGYWLVASDGGIFAFGEAAFRGSTGDMRLNLPIIGMAATSTGGGYWLVASDGGIFAFGDAPFLGSTGGTRLAQPITGMATLPVPGGGGPPPPPPGPGPVPAGPFDIGLIGDTGYSEAQEHSLLKVRDDMNRFLLAFVTHDGDIWGEGTKCADDEYLEVKGVFDGMAAPVVYTPGDNEWADCSNSAGRLTFIRQTFFPTDQTLGQRRMTVSRQSGMPENARWSHGGVVFAALNEPGSDGQGGAQRDRNLAWLNATFDEAENSGAAGVMIVWQDNPFEPSGGKLAKVLKGRAIAFGRPVVLVHGDTHTYRIDHPWGDVKNFTRVETFGDTSAANWVRATVDPASPAVFSFTTERAGS